MVESNNVKHCAFFKCDRQADVLITFSGVAGLTSCSFYLCSKHAATSAFNERADIISEQNLHEVKCDV